MKSISQFVKDGISTLADLQSALQVAMQLEFSTIPPYLCAQWSIDADPDGVDYMIGGIAVQEMYHFALVGNMLSAIGKVPDIANPTFMSSYPTNVLPGGIPQNLSVDLKPLSRDQLQVFMQIEYPQFPPVALAARTVGPATIGEFYDTIAIGFKTLNPAIDQNAHFVDMHEAVQIKNISDALDAIVRIKGEGEGTEGSPEQPADDQMQPAHYYKFKEIFLGKTLVQSSGKWEYTGATIQFPTVFSFQRSTEMPSPSLDFNTAISQLLIDLQTCWATGTRPSLGAMYKLKTLGQNLIRQGVLPEFLWVAPVGP